MGHGDAPQLMSYAVSVSQGRAVEIVASAIAEPDGLPRRMARELVDRASRCTCLGIATELGVTQGRGSTRERRCSKLP